MKRRKSNKTQYQYQNSSYGEEIPTITRRRSFNNLDPIQQEEVLIQRGPQKRKRSYGCLITGLLILFILFLLAFYFLFPLRTNVIIMGVDYMDHRGKISRTDSLMLTTVLPHSPYVGILSIPRDLWVTIPGVGENRINTAHFFAEANQSGTGPYAVIDTIQANFGVDVHYYVRVNFGGFENIIDAMGGLKFELTEPMGGLKPGEYHLNSEEVLAFVRDREGTDDFFRMDQGQFIIKQMAKQMLKPLNWFKIPGVWKALKGSVDTDLPFFEIPRMGLALMRVGYNGIDSRSVDRDLTVQFFTNQGASVLGPRWDLINLVLLEMFGQ